MSAESRGGICTHRPPQTMAFALLSLAVLSASASAILFRLASIAAQAPLTVAFYRMGLTVALLAGPLLWRRREALAGLVLRDVALCVVSGAFLALHFAAWFTSLNFTSVASSTVLVTTHPLMVLAFGYVVWNERVRPVALAGVGLAVAGAALVGWGDFAGGPEALFGDLLALLGAAAVGGYFLVGRVVRRRVDILAYAVLTYGVAATFLCVAAVAFGQPLRGFSAGDWLIFAALAVFPTILGHTLINWALRYLSASVISVSILGEPIGASLLAWLIWQQLPGAVTLLGGVVLVIGIGVFVLHTAKQE